MQIAEANDNDNINLIQRIMTSLLKRQLKKYVSDDLSGNLEHKSFLDSVAKSYKNYEEKLSVVQGATSISSEALSVAYGELLIEAEGQKQVETSLKRAVDSLNVNLGVTDKLEHNDNLNLGVEKMSKHVTMLASKKSSVTEERNTFQKDLEAQNEVLNNCAHIVSHDLKSPIKNINTLMSRILEEDENKFLPASIQNCSSVSHNILRIDNLINGILQHATVGDYMETPTNLDLRKLVQELANSSSVPSNITIKVDEFLPVISIQKYWVEQVFSNLIANAIKATEHLDYGVIAIDFIEDNLFWKFAIRGNGKVISQKYLVSIFYMFRKLENVANADGVGLSLVKKITCLYQGNIWLESEVNTGTTFYLTFKK